MQKIKIDRDVYMLLALFLGLAIIFIGIPKYQNYKTEKLKAIAAQESREREARDLLAAQRRDLDDTKQQILDLKNQSLTDKSIAQQKLSDLQRSISQSGSGSDYSKIVAKWADRVAEVTCEWQYTNGEVYSEAGGSALIANIKGYGITAITNKHVVKSLAHDGTYYFPTWCMVGVYGVGARMVELTDWPNPFFEAPDDRDWAYIVIDKAAGTDDNFFTNLPDFEVCRSADVGDKVVVLGYPAIGTTNGITATEGIISGIEYDYYVTSAKIDHGNSGGAAILAKDDCYLGIPTWAESGTVESLGRILKSDIVLID